MGCLNTQNAPRNIPCPPAAWKKIKYSDIFRHIPTQGEAGLYKIRLLIPPSPLGVKAEDVGECGRLREIRLFCMVRVPSGVMAGTSAKSFKLFAVAASRQSA